MSSDLLKMRCPLKPLFRFISQVAIARDIPMLFSPTPLSESIDESDPDKMHCLNNSGSSATYSDYSPSQGSSGSSNPPGNGATLQAAGKDGGVPQQHWTNRWVVAHRLSTHSPHAEPVASYRHTPDSKLTVTYDRSSIGKIRGSA